MFHAPNRGVPRRSVLVKHKHKDGSSQALNISDHSATTGTDLGILRASHSRKIRFNMQATVVHEFDKVPPSERRYVWYDPHEEAEMARLAAPRSLPRIVYDAIVSIVPTGSGSQFGGGSLFGEADANDPNASKGPGAKAKDEFHKTPKRLSVEQQRQKRILEDNQGVMMRALVMVAFVLILVGNAALNPPKPKGITESGLPEPVNGTPVKDL